jgi:RHS repeat-associated protein
MISGRNADGVVSNYIYNGFGHLVGKDSPEAKQFVLDYTMQIPTTLAVNDIRYVHGLERISQTNNGITLVYHNDRLGSAEKLTDLSGNVTASVRYDEWGNPSIIIPGLNPSFTGHEYDQVLGIYYARARFYDPVISRWLASDPYWDAFNRIFGEPSTYPVPNILAMMQSNNLYVYCINNPVKYVDPDGQSIYTLWELGTALFDSMNAGFDLLEMRQEERAAIARLEHMEQLMRIQGISYMSPFDPCAPPDEFTGFQAFTADSFMPSFSDIDMAYLFRWDWQDAGAVLLFVGERFVPTSTRVRTDGRLNLASGGGNRRKRTSDGAGRPVWDTNSDRTIQQSLQGQIRDLRNNPNLDGVNIDELVNKTPAQLEIMARTGEISRGTLTQIKKAFQGRNLRRGH